jgi:hypothetical protein
MEGQRCMLDLLHCNLDLVLPGCGSNIPCTRVQSLMPKQLLHPVGPGPCRRMRRRRRSTKDEHGNRIQLWNTGWEDMNLIVSRYREKMLSHDATWDQYPS